MAKGTEYVTCKRKGIKDLGKKQLNVAQDKNDSLIVKETYFKYLIVKGTKYLIVKEIRLSI